MSSYFEYRGTTFNYTFGLDHYRINCPVFLPRYTDINLRAKAKLLRDCQVVSAEMFLTTNPGGSTEYPAGSVSIGWAPDGIMYFYGIWTTVTVATALYLTVKVKIRTIDVEIPFEFWVPAVSDDPVAHTGKGYADFTYYPSYGDAPLSVVYSDVSEFDQEINPYLPGDFVIGNIISREWIFGDGQTGNGLDTAHIYDTPGVYTPRLLIEGANGRSLMGVAGGITVTGSDPVPIPTFDEALSSFIGITGRVYPGENFPAKITVKNLGKQDGNIWIRYNLNATDYTLVESAPISAQGEYIWNESHSIDWWLGFDPLSEWESTQWLEITFQVGIVGDDRPYDIWGPISFAVPIDEGNGGPVPDGEGFPWLPVALIGVGGVGLLALKGRKKKHGKKKKT